MFFEEDVDNKTIKLNISKNAPATIEQIINIEINEYINSDKYKEMQDAERYYKNNSDIMTKKRQQIDKNGNLSDATNLADNHIAHDYFATLIDQKIQYLLGKDWAIECDDVKYAKRLEDLFDSNFRKKLRKVGMDAIGKACGWMFAYPNKSELKFMRINPLNLIPLWEDDDHTSLNGIIYFYNQIYYEGTTKKLKKYAQYWDDTGVILLENTTGTYSIKSKKIAMLTMEGDETTQKYNWNKIPFIPLRYNEQEISLLRKVKGLIDDYDRQVSTNANLLEDDTNKIITIRNYGGTSPEDARGKISKSRIILTNDDGEVGTLDTTVDVGNTDKHLDRERKDIFTFGRGVDPNADFGANASAEARQYQYALLDMDCNFLERGCHDLLHGILWFVNSFYGKNESSVNFVFNRDIITNESAAIDMCVKSQSVQGLSMETILSNHPWVRDVDKEVERWDDRQLEEQWPTDQDRKEEK